MASTRQCVAAEKTDFPLLLAISQKSCLSDSTATVRLEWMNCFKKLIAQSFACWLPLTCLFWKTPTKTKISAEKMLVHSDAFQCEIIGGLKLMLRQLLPIDHFRKVPHLWFLAWLNPLFIRFAMGRLCQCVCLLQKPHTVFCSTHCIHFTVFASWFFYYYCYCVSLTLALHCA